MLKKLQMWGFLILFFAFLAIAWPFAYGYKLIKGQWPDWYNFVHVI